MEKNKLLKLALMIGGLLFIWMICSFPLYNKLKNIEDNYKESAIFYNYDSLNSLKDEPLVKVEEHDYYAKSCTKNTENEYFVEFENTYFGTVQINFPKPLSEDTTLEITIGELRNGNHVWTRQNAVANVHHSGQGVIYYKADITVKKDSNSYTLIVPERTRPTLEQLPNEWQGGVVPFGYCEIKGYNGTLLAENFIQKAVYYPFNDNDSSFESNDDILNSVYKLCKDTVKATTYAGIFVDGYRELRPYEADAYVNTLSWYSVSTDSQIVRNTLDTLLENHTWPSEWIYQTIFLAYEYYMQTGDTLYIQSIYPKLQDCLMEEQLNENGLIDINSNQESTLKNLGISQIRDIIDWPEVERDHFSTIKANNFSLKSAYAGLKNKYISFMAKIWGFNYTSELYLQLSNSYFSQGKEISSPSV